jgi:hypothetical protein
VTARRSSQHLHDADEPWVSALTPDGPGGMQIWDVRTGDNTGSVPGVMSSRYHAASHELAAVDGSILTSWQAS